LEIIGEAARQVPEEMQTAIPGIAWREIGGICNKLTNEYFSVNVKVVWRTFQEDLPPIISVLRKFLEL